MTQSRDNRHTRQPGTQGRGTPTQERKKERKKERKREGKTRKERKETERRTWTRKDENKKLERNRIKEGNNRKCTLVDSLRTLSLYVKRQRSWGFFDQAISWPVMKD